MFPIECPRMEDKNSTWQIIKRAVNQGIDSHLEGFTKLKIEYDVDQSVNCTRDRFTFDDSELPILLRRLREDGSEEAESLADDIEYVLRNCESKEIS